MTKKTFFEDEGKIEDSVLVEERKIPEGIKQMNSIVERRCCIESVDESIENRLPNNFEESDLNGSIHDN